MSHIPRALRDIVPYGPMYSRAQRSSYLRVLVIYVLRFLRVLMSHVPHALRPIVPQMPRSLYVLVLPVPRVSCALCPISCHTI